MEANTILFNEAIKLIDSGAVVKLEYVSFDQRQKKGGRLRYIVAKVNIASSERKSADLVADAGVSRKNNYSNFTRRMVVMAGETVSSVYKTVHLPLILKINDKRLLL